MRRQDKWNQQNKIIKTQWLNLITPSFVKGWQQRKQPVIFGNNLKQNIQVIWNKKIPLIYIKRISLLEIDDLLTTSTSLPKTDLPSHFDTILQKINNLEKRITESLTFIPSYDERQFSMVIKPLFDLLLKRNTLNNIYTAIKRIKWKIRKTKDRTDT